MRTVDLIGTAFANTFRSKLRTTLTVLAIFIGAFTLSLTSGLGTGITTYINNTVASVGATDVMTVTKTVDTTTTTGPQVYDPSSATTTQTGGRSGRPGSTVKYLSTTDLATITAVQGVQRVEPTRSVALDYVQYADGTKYQLSMSSFVQGMKLTLDAGGQPDESSDQPQIALPTSYVTPLGFGSAADAVGRTVTLALTDAAGTQHTQQATVVGVMADGLIASTGGVPNTALTDALYTAQSTGLAAAKTDQYLSASVWFDDTQSSAATTALKDRLKAAGFTATTVADQLGTVTSVIDTVILVLDGFAIIALLAAGIGIVNTLLMSVQERTREIGLMKAVGMGSNRVFALFSLEAVTIGFLGSALGVIGAVAVSQVVSAVAAHSFLSNLPGLTLISFNPASVAAVVLGVMALAFLAGTLPAARAARADPIASLRYE